MTALIVKRLIKTVMVATPFFAMTLMVLALWGIGGKATYTDIDPALQQVKFTPGEAKNYLVKGDQTDKAPADELETQKIVVEPVKPPTPKKAPIPEKIKWELVV